LGKIISKRRIGAPERSPRESFVWGKRVAIKIASKSGPEAAEEFVTMLRRKWQASKSVSDKKAYDGAKGAASPRLSSAIDYKPLDEKNIFNGVVSKSLYKAFGKPFLSKYGLKDLPKHIEIKNSIHNVPCVYFGCYTDRDLRQIQNNKSKLKVVVYGGTDATRRRMLGELKKIDGLYHVAISDYIAEDLRTAKIPYKQIGITPVDHSKYDLGLAPLGQSVYIYYGSDANAHMYGKGLFEKVQRRLPNIRFHVCGFGDHSREALVRIYKDSFIGLRLVEHDGLPNTVVEMGLMGRRVIHNGGLPSSIPYKPTAEDICRLIKKERGRWKDSGKLLITRDQTLGYLNNSRDWLEEGFWGGCDSS
jgi:hypothetical protein